MLRSSRSERSHRFVGQPMLYGCLAVFVIALGSCLAIRPPAMVVAQDGLSFYGTRRSTLVPYLVGMVAVAVAGLIAAALAARPVWWRRVLGTVALAVIPIMMTPYSLSQQVLVLHDAVSGCCFFGQFVLVVAESLRGGPLLRSVAVVLLVGDLLALAALIRPLPTMLCGQLISIVCFLALLISVVGRRTDSGPRPGRQLQHGNPQG